MPSKTHRQTARGHSPPMLVLKVVLSVTDDLNLCDNAWFRAIVVLALALPTLSTVIDKPDLNDSENLAVSVSDWEDSVLK